MVYSWLGKSATDDILYGPFDCFGKSKASVKLARFDPLPEPSVTMMT